MVEPLADMPMFEPAAKPDFVVFAGGSTSLASVKVLSDSVNTNTAPLRLLMPGWPAATMVPVLLTATAEPPPFSWAVCVQVLAPAALVNTRVTPAWGSPNAIVEPLAEIPVSDPIRAGNSGAGAGAGAGSAFLAAETADTVRVCALAADVVDVVDVVD